MESDWNEALEQQEDTMRERYITFTLGEEEYGIEIRFVTEIIGMQPITELPETQEYIRGIVNLRGKIIPVIDMRLKFKKDAVAYTDRTCILVIKTEDISAGLIVDGVSEVMSIADGDVAAPPNTRTGVHNKYLKGIGKAGDTVKLLLDCEKIFGEEEKLEINDTIEE